MCCNWLQIFLHDWPTGTLDAVIPLAAAALLVAVVGYPCLVVATAWITWGHTTVHSQHQQQPRQAVQKPHQPQFDPIGQELHLNSQALHEDVPTAQQQAPQDCCLICEDAPAAFGFLHGYR